MTVPFERTRALVMTRPLLPQDLPQITALGLRIQQARARRNVSVEHMAERLGVPLETLQRLEAGDASVDIATLYRALRSLGLKKDFYALAADKTLERKLLLIQSLADAKKERQRK